MTMFTFLFMTGLMATVALEVDGMATVALEGVIGVKGHGLKKIDLPLRPTLTRSTGEVNGPALLRSLQKTLNKYHSTAISATSANSANSANSTNSANSANSVNSVNSSLQPRWVTENLIDQVDAPDFDEDYYGPIQVGSASEQVFTVQFDTGSSDIFIPGPQCTTQKGCPGTTKYDQTGLFQGRSTLVQYGSGYIQGDDYIDSITVAGLTVTDQGLISTTQTSGFNTSNSDGLLGMAFTSIAASGFTTFFENLMIQEKVGSSHILFYYPFSFTILSLDSYYPWS